MILGGDLGGTKTLLALAERTDGKPRIIRKQRYASADYPDFDSLLGDFLSDAPTIENACFGLAGPTDGRRAKLTYLPWQLSANAIGRRFAIGNVHLANDFATAAHGLPLIGAEALIPLQTGIPLTEAPRLVIGAGTGLGVAGLIADGGRHRVIPGEGGHIGFSPQTAEQLALAQWLLRQRERVTTEDIVSGPGLTRIHRFLGGASLPPKAIADAAIHGAEPVAIATVDLWLACFGAFAGDLALHWLARGGVYLAGGVAGKLMPHVDLSPFLKAFNNKREHAHVAMDIPIQLITDEELGLKGALLTAAGR
ncbi:MAG: glucokinase [Betaproteobacteria bacterium HGW-Betaproteobacteria-7]|jgi:glucokinase|nr:MAG: glucokinase [Betaproteobacteria bacterium HGW-Betaproteobacteria-7]